MDITNNYDKRHISFINRNDISINICDKVLIFLTEGDVNTVWEDKHIVLGVFKIIDNKVYHYLDFPEWISIDELIKIIQEYRMNDR